LPIHKVIDPLAGSPIARLHESSIPHPRFVFPNPQFFPQRPSNQLRNRNSKRLRLPLYDFVLIVTRLI